MLFFIIAPSAGLHSFSQSLRHQLKGTSVKVVEIVPPAVNTDFLPQNMKKFGANIDAFSDSVFQQLLEGKEEITFGGMEKITQGDRKAADGMFKMINR